MDDDWIEKWIASVMTGQAAMSQRTLSSIQRNGGLRRAVSVARRHGVHLVQLTDDHGKQLVAASLERFRTLC